MKSTVITFLTFCLLCTTVAFAADIVMDVNNVSHQFKGFGAQIWSGDTRISSILTSLNMKYVRMKFGGAWSPPTDATQAQMDAYVASRYDSDTAIRNTYALLNQYGIKVVANFFEGPSAWLGSGNRLKSANFDDIARLWGSIVYYMNTHNMPITYVEMFNEPEGDWNIYVPGPDYATVAKLLRAELDSRGLTNVQICGPGLAYLYNAPNWFDDFDSQTVTSIGAWSTHAWDEGWGHTDALPSFLDSRYRDYFDAAVLTKDPTRVKPVIVTEYATGVRTFNGVTFTEANVADSNQFAQRSYENSLTLLNNGANIILYWQAADHDWMSSGMYGFMRKQSLGSTLRPVYYAFTTLMPYIPNNAMVLRKIWNDPVISAAGFVADNNLVLAFANCSANTVNRTVQLNGITSFSLLLAKAFVAGAVIDKTSEIDFDYASSTLSISLPRESTLTVVAKINECTDKLSGDIDGDCKVTFSDFAALASNWMQNNQSQAEGTVIDNFESYADTNALVAQWVPWSGTTTLTLDTSIVHSGSKSMRYQYNTGNSPYFARAMHWLVGNGIGVDWTGYNTLRLWFKCTAKKEPLQVNIVNKYGQNVLQVPYGTPQVGDWTKWDIDLTPIPSSELQQIGRVDIFFTANYYGPGEAYFDDIEVFDSNSIECAGQLDGDLTQDCIVDFRDLAVLSDNWLNCTLIDQQQCW